MKKLFRKISTFAFFLCVLGSFAQIKNETGLPGKDLIFFEDTKLILTYPKLPVSGYTIKKVKGGKGVNGSNKNIPEESELGYTRPANNYPKGDPVVMRSVRIDSQRGEKNLKDDVWIMVQSMDLSDYDGGEKYFTFSARSRFFRNGGNNIDTNNKIYYTTNFSTGSDPESSKVKWTEISKSELANIGNSKKFGAKDEWTTHTINLSDITCGENFAIAIRRKTTADGPNSQETSLGRNNKNGLFSVSGLVYTGTKK